MTINFNKTLDNASNKMFSYANVGKILLPTASLLFIQMNLAHAATPKATINNIANADYQVDDNKLTTTSNIVNTAVFTQPKYALRLTQPLRITLRAGEIVQWENILSNDSYSDETVEVHFDIPSVLSNFQVYIDANDNGIIDDEDQLLKTNFSLKAGKQVRLLVRALTASTLKEDEQVGVPIHAKVLEDPSITTQATDTLIPIESAIRYKDGSYDQTPAQVEAGKPVFLEVGLAYCNANPTAVDYVWLNVKSKLTGDTITLKAVETGENTGKYRISAPTEFNANANPQDYIIQTLNGDTLDTNATSCETATGDKKVVTSDMLPPVAINVIHDSSVLTIEKEASVKTAEIGDFVDYTINAKNASNIDADNVELKDDLPMGFTYVKNSVRVDGVPYTPDFVKSGKYMTLGLGTLKAQQSKKITYRVSIDPTAISGTGNNIAHLTGTANNAPISSRPDDAPIKVESGRLNTEGVIIGKVYADFNRDGIQQKDHNELGVAGVRLYLEDGTFVVTDSEGKYSLYGISAKTHVIKLDRTTLPRNVELIEQTNRNAGDPGSRFVDLKYGELHRADFAITDGINDGFDDDAKPLIADLQKRAKQVIAKNDALEQAVKSTLELEPQQRDLDINRNNIEKIEAEGCKDAIDVDGQIGCNSVIYDEQTGKEKTVTSKLVAKPTAPMQVLEIEKALSTADDKRIDGVTADADFLNLKDGQRVDINKIRVQIKAPKGATTQLFVNNSLIDAGSVGKEVAWEKEGISGFDYVAVPLQKGNNTLAIKSSDSTGKLISSKTITVHAPDNINAITTQTSANNLTADGVSEYQVVVSLKDIDNQSYTATAPVSLDSDIGTILLKDNDKNQAGVQTTIEGGELLVPIKAPSVAGKGNLVIRAGVIEKVIPLQFTPKLRPMIASGIVEGVVSFNNLGKGLESANKDDGFEEELHSLSTGDKTSTQGRSAFFLKGKVRGDYLLTMAYDSDKDGKDRLFRDIRPDEYYPVYGDASAKGFDAQSTSKLYVRVDKGRSFAMYGDIKTHIETSNDYNEGLSLGQYDRTLTGLKTHYETDTTDVTAFLAQTRASQKVNETRGLGISGPYPIGADFDSVLVNSETVEVIVRDRNNSGLILSRQVLSRFSDYDVDTLSQALYLRSPIASQDLNGNPIYLRVTVEADNAGEEYLVGGIAGSRKLNNKIRIGGSYVQSDDPTNNEKLSSINAVVKFNDRLKLVAETAHYDSDNLGINSNVNSQINAQNLTTESTGNANRVELSYKNAKNDAKLYYNQADSGFDPLSSPIIAGRTEAGLKATSELNPKTHLKAEVIQSKDETSNAEIKGATVSIERKLTKNLTAELGVRHYEKDALASATNYQEVASTTSDPFNQSLRPSVTNNTSDYQGTTLRGKLTADLPKLNKSRVFAEYEQDINDSSRNAWSVGGETSLFDKGRLYFRHELASTLLGDYGLDGNDEHQATIIGVDANYMKNGQAFSEYRVKDGISSREAEAAIGLRNKWQLKDGVYLNTSFEHLESLSGAVSNDATAVTLGLDYLASEDYKFTGRVEKRWGEQTDTLLNTLGYARKVNDDVTILAKNNFSLLEDNKTDKDRTIDRFQLGMAYRDYDNNILDHLAKLEYRYDNNEIATSPYTKQTYIASLHTNYHPVRRLTLSGHYAGKYSQYEAEGIDSDSTTQLLAGRAMYDVNERWDVGLQAGTMWSDNHNARYLFGAEVGYNPMANLWLSAGYNFAGYHDDDIADGNDNQQGAYVRLRFKFDEDLFKKKRPTVNSRLDPVLNDSEVK